MVECLGSRYPASAVHDSGMFGSTFEGNDSLESLSGIRCIDGMGLTVEGVSDIAALASLERVRTLVIADSPLLADLTPLADAVSIENLLLVRLDGLDGIEGLGPLDKLQDSLLIDDCSSLSSLAVPEGAVALRSVQVFQTPSLEVLGRWAGTVETIDLRLIPELPHALAVTWADGLGAELSTCGLLDDPTAECSGPPPPP